MGLGRGLPGLGAARPRHRRPPRRPGRAAPRGARVDRERERVPAICIIGRPNVGKSSILNALLGEDRVVVHDQPGTTRDPIDTLIEVDDQPVVLIDTAGLRRRGQMRDGVEHYSQIRALQAAERSDVAIVVCRRHRGAHRLRPVGGRPLGARALRHAAGDQQVGPRPARPRAHPRAAALQVAPAPADRGLLGRDGGGAAPDPAGRAAAGGALPGPHLDARAQRGAARAGGRAARPAQGPAAPVAALSGADERGAARPSASTSTTAR